MFGFDSDWNPRLKHFMDRAAAGDGHQPVLILVEEFPAKRDGKGDLLGRRGGMLAAIAIIDIRSLIACVNGDFPKGKIMMLRIRSDDDRGARCRRNQKHPVWRDFMDVSDGTQSRVVLISVLR